MSLLIQSFCSIIMISIGIYAYRKKEPMWFWAGSEDEVAKENISDIKTYNHKNGMMWILYGLSFFLPFMIAYFFHLTKWIFLLLNMGIIIGGMVVMMLYYQHLHDSYFVK